MLVDALTRPTVVSRSRSGETVFDRPKDHRDRRQHRPRARLKFRHYANLLRRNPWLLTPNEKSWNYIRYRLTRHRETVDTAKVGPVFLSINVSRRCNLTCSFCIVGQSLNKPDWRESEATVDGMRRLLDHPVPGRCLYVMLTGGEPLLNRDIIPIVRVIKKRRHLLALTSNGILLKDRLDDLCEAGLDSINLSLYDTNKDALADILPLASRRLYCKIVKIIGQPDARNAKQIDETLRLARETGCGQVYFQNVLPHDDPDGLLPIYDDDEDYPDIVRELTRSYTDLSISWPAGAPHAGSAGQKKCRMPWYLLLADERGRLGFCCSHSVCNRGSIYDMSPHEVMATEEWDECRRDMLSTSGNVPSKCVGCYVLNDPWASDV